MPDKNRASVSGISAKEPFFIKGGLLGFRAVIEIECLRNDIIHHEAQIVTDHIYCYAEDFDTIQAVLNTRRGTNVLCQGTLARLDGELTFSCTECGYGTKSPGSIWCIRLDRIDPISRDRIEQSIQNRELYAECSILMEGVIENMDTEYILTSTDRHKMRIYTSGTRIDLRCNGETYPFLIMTEKPFIPDYEHCDRVLAKGLLAQTYDRRPEICKACGSESIQRGSVWKLFMTGISFTEDDTGTVYEQPPIS